MGPSKKDYQYICATGTRVLLSIHGEYIGTDQMQLDAVNEITIRVCISLPVVLFLDSRVSVSARQSMHGFLLSAYYTVMSLVHHLVLANRLVAVGENKKVKIAFTFSLSTSFRSCVFSLRTMAAKHCVGNKWTSSHQKNVAVGSTHLGAAVASCQVKGSPAE